jgi:hypothetical protein
VPVGESKLTDPLPWDTISASKYRPFGEVSPYLASLRGASAARLAADPAFVELRQQLARLKSRLDDNTLSLNEARRRRELAQDKASGKAIASKAEAEESGIPAYEITVAAAAQAGLPARMSSTPKRPGDANAKPGDDGLEDPESGAAAHAADELILDESLHVLGDYVGLLEHPPAGAGHPARLAGPQPAGQPGG